ncbi:YdcF family protein [Anaerobacillus sp. MEB173]|uniref:YdcF family protein n=1 Tax=Anaerobacillus sp. MEB173 TaxID=3383345 RepID=UPI003F8F1692
MKINIVRGIVILMCLSLVTFIVHSGFSIWSYAEYNQLTKADAAIVLGAAAWGDEPSPVFRERINHSIWLYENGYVDKIIFTGGKGEGDKYSESEVARKYALKHHVRGEDIFIETKSKITEENFKYAKEIGFANNLKTFIIVSDPLHMKRATLIAKNFGMEVYSSPTPSSAYQSKGSKIPFFCRELFFYLGYKVSLLFR